MSKWAYVAWVVCLFGLILFVLVFETDIFRSQYATSREAVVQR